MEKNPISIFHKASPEDREIFTTVGKRTHTADKLIQTMPNYDRLHGMERQDWLKMDIETYNDLECAARDIYEATNHVRTDNGENPGVSAMSVNFDDIVKHIRVMQHTMGELWDQGLASVFPQGTTIDYVNWLCLSHDLYRFANINGPLPLDYVDRVSDKKTELLFPNSPAKEHLHTMAMITGIQPLPADDNPIPSIFKLVDTTGKQFPRFPNELFTENGAYDDWVQRQVNKGSLPFHAVKPSVSREERFRLVTVEDYRSADISLTLKGLEQLEKVIPGVDYNAVLKRAADRVANDPDVVTNFGRRTEVFEERELQVAA